MISDPYGETSNLLVNREVVNRALQPSLTNNSQHRNLSC